MALYIDTVPYITDVIWYTLCWYNIDKEGKRFCDWLEFHERVEASFYVTSNGYDT